LNTTVFGNQEGWYNHAG